MTQFIIWLVVIGGVIAAGWAIVAHIEGIGKAKQLAADHAAIAVCEDNIKTATTANVTLQESVNSIRADRDLQNKEVEKWKAIGLEASNLALAWRAKYADQQTALQRAQAQAHASSLRPTDPKQTCNQVLDEMNTDAGSWVPERAVRMNEILGLPPPAPGLTIK